VSRCSWWSRTRTSLSIAAAVLSTAASCWRPATCCRTRAFARPPGTLPRRASPSSAWSRGGGPVGSRRLLPARRGTAPGQRPGAALTDHSMTYGRRRRWRRERSLAGWGSGCEHPPEGRVGAAICRPFSILASTATSTPARRARSVLRARRLRGVSRRLGRARCRVRLAGVGGGPSGSSGARLRTPRLPALAVATSVSQGVSALSARSTHASDRIVISEYEFPTVGQTLRAGARAEVVHVRRGEGRILPRLRRGVDDRTALVCCTTISFRTGHRHDVPRSPPRPRGRARSRRQLPGRRGDRARRPRARSRLRHRGNGQVPARERRPRLSLDSW
jgi:hypothetical protein